MNIDNDNETESRPVALSGADLRQIKRLVRQADPRFNKDGSSRASAAMQLVGYMSATVSQLDV